MPFDSQGNFTRVMSWQEDAANAVPIVASRHDDEDDNFAQGFNECYCRDGRAPATGNFKMGSYKITGLGNGTTDNDAVNKSQLDTKAGLSANNTFTGLNTFAGEIVRQISSLNYGGIKVKNTAITKGTTPSTNAGGQFTFQDSTTGTAASSRIGGMEVLYDSSGQIINRLNAYKPTANSTEYASIEIHYKADGTKYATAPTPSTRNDNSNKIATTEWVNNSELPDWTAKISITPDYTFSEKGFLLAWQYTISGQAAYLNGQVILESEGGHDFLGANYNTIFIPVDVGDKLTGTVTGAIFMPCKGA